MRRVDVAIVGGGPAGLAAATMLARCLRHVVLIDAGEPRNRKAHALHAFLSRDGIPPAELLRAARADLRRYPSVELRAGRVTTVTGRRGAFVIKTETGPGVQARRVLLATGVTDVIPPIPGIAGLYGRSVHHCPHCDAYEYADQPLAIYGHGAAVRDAALEMLAWTSDIVVLTDAGRVSAGDRRTLAAKGVAVRTEAITRLIGKNGKLQHIEFLSGPPLRRAGLFLATGQHDQCDLAEALGCVLSPEGAVETDEHEATGVPGVYVAGDASVREQMVIVAAAEGTMAATKIHESLWKEDLRRGAARRKTRPSTSRRGTGSGPFRGAASR